MRTGTKGTGQASTTAPSRGAAVGRSYEDRSLKTSAGPKMSSQRRDEPPQRGTVPPAVAQPKVQMVRYAKPPTARERAFNKAIATPGGREFATAYERNAAKIDVLQQGTATKTGYRKNKAQ